MNSSSILANQIWQPTGSLFSIRNAVLAIAGSVVVAIAAQVNIPMYPVPMTLQTLAVLAIGAGFGARLGAATLALYAIEGAAGLPFFAQMKSGLAVITGATGGYIVGFILAAALVGYLAERGWDKSLGKMVLASLLGAAVLYIPGLIWLHNFAADWAQTFEWGFTPFLAGDIVKAVIAALGFQAAWMSLGKK